MAHARPSSQPVGPDQARSCRPRKLWRWLSAALLLLVSSAGLLFSCAAFGASAEGTRLARMQRSPQWHDGAFKNPQPLWNDFSFTDMLGRWLSGGEHRTPEDPENDIPVVATDPSRFRSPPPSGLRVTWFGHSSLLIELDGKRILTDPIWGPRASPFTWIGPERWYEPPIALDALPPIDVVVLSHDHYDHLDYPTFQTLKDWNTVFLVPLGVAAHLEHWGVPSSRIVELDWWEQHQVAGLTLVCTPARHASGRGVFDRNHTLWAGWAMLGPEHKVFFSGDTGLFDGMKRIGSELGPFDLVMVEVGAYDPAWPDWHSGPEQAVLASQWLQGRFFLPVHWGTFNLAFHPWTEPAERVLAAAEASNVATYLPRPGESFEPAHAPPAERWWPEVPWRTAEELPIVATAANGRPARNEE